jgi:hypothetical protein
MAAEICLHTLREASPYMRAFFTLERIAEHYSRYWIKIINSTYDLIPGTLFSFHPASVMMGGHSIAVWAMLLCAHVLFLPREDAYRKLILAHNLTVFKCIIDALEVSDKNLDA